MQFPDWKRHRLRQLQCWRSSSAPATWWGNWKRTTGQFQRCLDRWSPGRWASKGWIAACRNIDLKPLKDNFSPLHLREFKFDLSCVFLEAFFQNLWTNFPFISVKVFEISLRVLGSSSATMRHRLRCSSRGTSVTRNSTRSPTKALTAAITVLSTLVLIVSI